MKIGYDAKRLYNNFTGLGNYSRTLVHNLLTYAPGVTACLFTPGVKQSPVFQEIMDHPATRTITPGKSKSPLWRSYFIKKQLLEQDIKVFHGLSNEIPFSLKSSKIASVVTVHDLIFKVYPETYRYFDRQMYDLKFRYSCQNAQKVIAISESTRQDIIKYYKVPPHAVEVLNQACLPLFYQAPTPVHENLLSESYGIPSEYMLYVGSVIPRKNLKTIIAAMALLPAHLHLPLVVVGNGKEYKNEILREIARLGMQNRIIWVGHLYDNKHLQQVYCGARLLIYPSIYEGFGLPVVEALLSGAPVITSGVSSLPEAGGPSTLYLQNPMDTEEMASLITQVLSNEALAREMSQQGLMYARKTFDPKTLTLKLVEMYNQLL